MRYKFSGIILSHAWLSVVAWTSRLAPGGLVVTISLVRKFSAWMLSLVRMQTSRQLTKRSLRTELLDLLARLAL